MAQIAQTTDFRVRKGLVVENTATILSTIGTTGTNSGALQVVGGVGIGGNLFVGGVITATTYYGIFAGSFAGVINTATNLGAGVANQIPYQSAPGATSYSSNLVFNGTTFTTTNITITGVTGTIGTNTGALQVVGGVGVAGNLFVGGTITATNLVLTGNETEAGVLSITNVTGTTGTNTGALIVAGGVGIGGDLYIGGTGYIQKSSIASKVDGVIGWTWESVATLGTANTDITFKPDGTKMFMVGSSIQQWTLSPAWTLVGASAGTSYSMAAIDTGAQGLAFSPDGTKMVTVGDTAVANATVSSLAAEDRAHYFTLSTPWDPSSATLVSSIRFAITDQGLPAAESLPAGCAYNTDGTSFYMVGRAGYKVYQYTLSTPFVVSTASATYSKQLSIVNEDTGPTGISFNYTGTRMYIIGQTYDQVFEYRLGTAWDIATAVFYDKYFVGAQNGSMIGLYVNDTSTNYTYLASSTGVYRYTATTQATVITAETTNSGIVLYGNTRIKGGPNNNLVVDQNIYASGANGITLYTPTIGAGQSGVTANIFIGISTGGLNLYTSQSTGAFNLGGTAAGGTLSIGRSTVAQTLNLSNGATTAAFLKVVNIATGGLAGSTSTVNIGPALGTGTVTVNAGAVVYIANVNNAVSTSTGALQVAGGVGIGGGLVVGGTITSTNAIVSGSIAITGNITATIITATTSNIIGNETVGGSVAVTGNISAVTVTATTFVGALTGNVTGQASSATNIIGGAAGSILIQSAPNVTAFIPQGTTGYVLTAASGNTATWQALSGLAAGTATNAINVQVQAQPLAGTYYPTFVNANNVAATYLTEYTTSSLSINPGTGIVSVNNIVATTSGTFGTAASNAVVSGIYSNNSVYASFTSNAISSSAQVNLDNYSSTVFRTAKYVVQIVDGTKVHVAEYLLFHDGTYVYLTPYAVSSNTGELGTFDAQISGGTVTLLFTPNYTPSSMIIKVVRTGITA